MYCYYCLYRAVKLVLVNICMICVAFCFTSTIHSITRKRLSILKLIIQILNNTILYQCIVIVQSSKTSTG